MIYGSGNKGNLNLLCKLQQKGVPWPLGAIENKRSFCSIDNVSYVIQQLIEKDIESGIYQLADDETLSTNELISQFRGCRIRKELPAPWSTAEYYAKHISPYNGKLELWYQQHLSLYTDLMLIFLTA